MTAPRDIEPLATFCGKCDCGCPQLWVDPDADLEKRIVITDDFGQRIQMSPGQLESLIDQARAGTLDKATHTPTPSP